MDHRDGLPLPMDSSTSMGTGGHGSLGSGTGPRLPQCHSGDSGGQFSCNTTGVIGPHIEDMGPNHGVPEHAEDATDTSQIMPPPSLPPKQRPATTHTGAFLRLERPLTEENIPQFKYGKAEALKLDFKGRSKDAQVENSVPSQIPQLVRSGNKAATAYTTAHDLDTPRSSTGDTVIGRDNRANSDTSCKSQAVRVHSDVLQAAGYELARPNSDAENMHYSLPVTSRNPRSVDTLEQPPPYNARQKRKSRHNKYREANLGSNAEPGFSQFPLRHRHIQATPLQVLSSQTSRTRRHNSSTTSQHPPPTIPRPKSPQPFLDLQLNVVQQFKRQPQLGAVPGVCKSMTKQIQRPRASPPEVMVISDDDDDDDDGGDTVAAASHRHTVQNADPRESSERGSVRSPRGSQPPQGQPSRKPSADMTGEGNIHGTFHPSFQGREPALQDHTVPHEPTQTLSRQSPSELRVQKFRPGRTNSKPYDPSDGPWAPARAIEAIRTLSECAQWNGGQLEAKDEEVRSGQAQIKNLNVSIQQLQEKIEVLRDENAEKSSQLDSATKQLREYQEKYSGFKKSLDGLASDGNACKEELRALAQRYEDAVSDRGQLESMCQEAKQSAAGLAGRIRDLERFPDEARHEVLQLQATVEILRRELDEKSGLLAAERDRTSKLETDSAVNNQRLEELKELFTGGQQSILAQLGERISLAKESGRNGELTLEFLSRISDLIALSSSEVSGLITSSSNEICERLTVEGQTYRDITQAGKEREQLLEDDIASLKTSTMLLEQQNLSLTQCNTTTAGNLRCSQEKVLELEKGIAAVESELSLSNERVSDLQLEMTRLSSVPQVDPEALTKLEELKTVNGDLCAKLEEEYCKAFAHKEDAQQATSKLTLALQEVQDLKNAAADFNQQKSEYQQQAKQAHEDDRTLFQKTAASVRQEELFQFERSIQQAANKANKAEEKAARLMRQKQLTDETLFVLENKVDALRKSEEIAIAGHQGQMKQLQQEFDSHTAEVERRLTTSERERDAAEAKALELEHKIAGLEETHEAELRAKPQIGHPFQRNSPPCLNETMVQERQELHRAVSSGSSSPLPAKIRDELRGSPSVRKTETTELNGKTSNTTKRYSSPDERLLEIERFSIPEAQPIENSIASFSNINRPNELDSSSDSELTDILEGNELQQSPRATTPHKEPQGSNTSKKKQISIKIASSKAAIAALSPAPSKTMTNPSSGAAPKPARTYGKPNQKRAKSPVERTGTKRQGEEDSGAFKGHGKKRAKLNDLGIVVPDSQASDNGLIPPVRRKSGESLFKPPSPPRERS
ncbi:MAG: hypothetical protein M1839_003078 [Geoglossum umbratile]|nr:MAG: hypothetical protein M1839_003078 [Geoglossum umbratile]